jgi:thiamine-phosphate pyrophosphorylase
MTKIGLFNELNAKGYYFITDTKLSCKGNASDVKSALACGVKVVQYRNKFASSKELYEEALKLKFICEGAGLFLINDRVDIALAVNADGVHLGNDDLPYALARKCLGKNKIIGLTVHSLKEAKAAQAEGADYIGISPIFRTQTKKDAGRPAGINLIRAIREEVSIPIVAIGGIDLSNAAQVIAVGADCICAISAVVSKPDVKKDPEIPGVILKDSYELIK